MWSRKQLIDKQAEFWVLMARGSTLIAACEAVGVDRRTGRHWRQATGGRIPRRKPPPSGRFLCLEDRLLIADLHLAGVGVRAIAVKLSRSASTVSRELIRNGPSPSPSASGQARGEYAPYAAQKRAELRAHRPKASKFDDPELASVVQAKLCVKWSPEQISLHVLARPFFVLLTVTASHTTPPQGPPVVPTQNDHPCMPAPTHPAAKPARTPSPATMTTRETI